MFRLLIMISRADLEAGERYPTSRNSCPATRTEPFASGERHGDHVFELQAAR
jgi:hypothetical protein